MPKNRTLLLVVSSIATLLVVTTSCAESLAPGLGGNLTTDPPNNISTTLPPGSPGSFLDSIDHSQWKLTEAEAIAIASRYVPPEIVAHAVIHAGFGAYGNTKTGETHYYSEVAFMNILITKAWLGWEPDTLTTVDGYGPYNEIIVTLDGATGDLLSRKAYFGVFLGGPGMSPSFTNLWVPPTPVT